MSKKRTLRRLPYAHKPVANVLLETAGTVDLDVEIKVVMGESNYSIDVHKKHIDQIKDLYKALLKIAEIQYENDVMMRFAQSSVDTAVRTLGTIRTDLNINEQFQALNQYNFNWRTESREKFVRTDFGDVFEKFINN